MPLNLSGQNVFLRALEERDLARLVDSYKDLDLQLTTDGDAPPMSDVQVKAFWSDIMAAAAADLRYFAIEPLPGQSQAGEMVGACSLQHIDLRNRHAELSIFMVAPDVRGLGYGTDAVRLLLRYGFEALRLDKVYLGVYDFNEGGIRAYEKAGFRYEGRHRQMLHYEGRYWDEWTMGMLRAEWEISTQLPADGLRPYHPDDLEAAIALIQAMRKEASPDDSESARALLRRWWRQFDRILYGYQVDEKLVALLTLLADTDGKTVVGEMLVDDTHRAALQHLLESRL